MRMKRIINLPFPNYFPLDFSKRRNRILGSGNSHRRRVLCGFSSSRHRQCLPVKTRRIWGISFPGVLAALWAIAWYFYTPEIQKKLIGAIHKEAMTLLKKKGDIMETTSLYEMIKSNLTPTFGKVNVCLIDAVLDIFDELVKGEEKYIGLTKWKILNPSTLKDKAIYVFKKEKNPIHFVELANKISNYFGEAVKVATIHNELIRNNEFVLIGRGIYVLKEWGYKPGTVLDVIMDIFTKAKTPLSTEEIIARVLKSRKVKTSTIYMNLQNKQQIERVGRNMYQLKQA